MYCSKCGAKATDGAAYCASCGAALGATSAAGGLQAGPLIAGLLLFAIAFAIAYIAINASVDEIAFLHVMAAAVIGAAVAVVGASTFMKRSDG